MCEVEFFGRCCVGGRCIRLFFMWVDCPLAHYQIVDLEDIVYGWIVNEQMFNGWLTKIK
jgi:hypothetical protein